MLIQDVSAERFAQLFHQYHRALARGSQSPWVGHANEGWADLPPSEKNRAIAAARLALLEVELIPGEEQSRPYFAKPGEAEWGC